MKSIFQHSKNVKIYASLLLAFLMTAGSAFNHVSACFTDQKMETWNGGTSERNLPGYSEWQSFTAGASAGLCQIDLMFCNSNNILYGKGTLRIFEGTGIAGKLLGTQSVMVDGRAYAQNKIFWQSWVLTNIVPVHYNSVYTFQFIPVQGGGLPDPYLIQVNTNDAYPGGRNSQRDTWDNPFRTHLNEAVLPVDMLYFNAHAATGKVILDWATGAEINHLNFTVERSGNDHVFSSISIITAKGGAEGHVYSYTDNKPLQGNNYYRLKQTDRDGRVSYSSVINTAVNDTRGGISVYPNPASDILHVYGLQPGSEMRIINVNGDIVRSARALTGTYNWSVQSLAPGFYYISINSNGNMRTVRFIKK